MLTRLHYVDCSHHWELKKKFMEHHKDRFPEEALESRKFTHLSRKYLFPFQVGLAQTFGNMEFMGCQYPQVTRSCLKLFRNAKIFLLQETQERINELSFGIVNDFREGQKNKLKRTFVSGSHAANRKVNRL